MLDDEKNPVLQDISHMWSNEVLGLKISLLGAFFERYFMPIHLALKNATVQARVFTNMMKIKHAALQNFHHWHDDWGVVDIKMPHTVTLGSLQSYSDDPLHRVVGVGRNTPFGYQDIDSPESSYVNIVAGVDYLEDIITMNIDSTDSYDHTDDNELMTIWGNIRGHVGVVVPIEVKSGKNASHRSLDKFVAKFQSYVSKPYLLWMKDRKTQAGVEYLPIYMASCLAEA